MGKESRAHARDLVVNIRMDPVAQKTHVSYKPDDPSTAARVLLAGLNAVLTKLEPKAAPIADGGNGKARILKPTPAQLQAAERTKVRGS